MKRKTKTKTVEHWKAANMYQKGTASELPSVEPSEDAGGNRGVPG